MATSWPKQYGDARNFETLGSSLRTGVEIRMAEQHQALELYAGERAGLAEREAKKHAEERISAEIESVATQLRSELAMLREELLAVSGRTSVAENAIQELQAGAAEATRHRLQLQQGLEEEIVVRTEACAEIERCRLAMEVSWCQKLQDAVDQGAAARTIMSRDIEERIDHEIKQMSTRVDKVDESLRAVDQQMWSGHGGLEMKYAALDARLMEAEVAWKTIRDFSEQLERSTKEWVAGCRDHTETRIADSCAYADSIVEAQRNNVNVELCNVKSLVEFEKQSLEANLEKVTEQVVQGIDTTRAHTDRLVAETNGIIRDTSSAFHTSLEDARRMMDDEIRKVLSGVGDAETSLRSLVSEAEARSLKNATEQIEGRISTIKRDLDGVKIRQEIQIEEVHRTVQANSRLADERCARSEENVRKTEATVLGSVQRSVDVLRSEFEEALRGQSCRLEAIVTAEREKASRMEITDYQPSA